MHASRRFAAITLAALLLLAAAPAVAQTVQLDAAADTYLKQGQANKNQGDESVLTIRSGNRTLVAFDHAALLAAVGSATVSSATLRFSISSIQIHHFKWFSSGRGFLSSRI